MSSRSLTGMMTACSPARQMYREHLLSSTFAKIIRFHLQSTQEMTIRPSLLKTARKRKQKSSMHSRVKTKMEMIFPLASQLSVSKWTTCLPTTQILSMQTLLTRSLMIRKQALSYRTPFMVSAACFLICLLTDMLTVRLSLITRMMHSSSLATVV